MTAPTLLVDHAGELEAALGRPVKVQAQGDRAFVVVEGLPLPEGLYTASRSDLLLITDFQYPHSAMDMFWLEEAVTPKNGQIPGYCSAVEEYIGRRWRRWSWHRQNRWTPGADDLLSHFAFVEQCWVEELRGAAPRT